jgi:hypothetical protein
MLPLSIKILPILNILMISIIERIPKLKKAAKIAHIMRMMKVMIGTARTKRQQFRIGPTPLIPTMSITCLNNPKREEHPN